MTTTLIARPPATSHANDSAIPFAAIVTQNFAGVGCNAPAYAVRHKARRPDAVMGQAGWYLSSVSAPIVAATWTAAVGSAHAAIDAADIVISGDRYAYALCRPSGHHAHRDRASGFCYLNDPVLGLLTVFPALALWLPGQMN